MKGATLLLLYTDQYYLIKQVYPFGLDLIANYLCHYGHRVTLAYPFLPDSDLKINLRNILEESRPDIIGLGIRNLDTCLSCEPDGDYVGNDFRTFYFLPEIKRIVDLIRTHSPDVPIIAGGGGFTISPQAILNYLVSERKALLVLFRVVADFCSDEKLPISYILPCLFTSVPKGIVVLSS